MSLQSHIKEHFELIVKVILIGILLFLNIYFISKISSHANHQRDIDNYPTIVTNR